jgi:hypothetical protein
MDNPKDKQNELNLFFDVMILKAEEDLLFLSQLTDVSDEKIAQAATEEYLKITENLKRLQQKRQEKPNA